MKLESAQIKKLNTLVFSDELSFVKQGLTLWEILIDHNDIEAFKHQIKLISEYSNDIEHSDLSDAYQLKIIWQKAPQRHYISVWNLGISAVFSELELQKLEDLDLLAFQLPALPETLSLLQNLKHLNLEENYLTELPEELGKLSKLESLNLCNNHIRSLQANICLPSLQQIDLSENRLQTFPPFLSRSAQLTTLWLSSNNLSKLDRSIGSLSALQALYLSENNLTDLPESFSKLDELKNLDLSQNNFREIPSSLGLLPSLETLNLSSNHFEKIDFSENFAALKILQINYNKNINLQISVESLANLEELSLRDNHLSSLPTRFSSLQNLLKLDLSQNALGEQPIEIINDIFKNIAGLPRLQNLTLCQNKLNALSPEAFETMLKRLSHSKSLVSLSLSNNSLFYLPNLSSGFQALEALTCENNRLGLVAQEIWESTFEMISRFSSLNRLNLSSNRLSSIPKTIGNIKTLEQLILADNLLQTLPTELHQLQHLTVLDLGNNTIAYQDPEDCVAFFETISSLPKLKQLNLGRNGFSRLTDPFFSQIFSLLSQNTNLETLTLQENYLTPERVLQIQTLFPQTKIQF